ncbi:hypothetical protein MMC07_002452 [Pseudocyphellaria aurata]|nr:hypothetical protein [Pseudocyphellaria aurata]
MPIGEGFDVASARAKFPALTQPQVYFDNAGGSQTLSTVISSITEYLEATNVQTGASYHTARKSTELCRKGLEASANFINADADDVVIGPSTTQLFSNLSIALEFAPHAEIILSTIDHGANISSWLRIAKVQNLSVKWWTPPSAPTDLTLNAENLRPLLSDKTRLVACTHTSNILGTIHDIRAIADEVHRVPGAMLCVDGVAFAPHREVDVKAMGVDFYAFSWYKVYGPHLAVLYASRSSQTQLRSLAQYFHPSDADLSTRLGLAGASYELMASIPSVVNYFGSSPKEAWNAIALHEERLQSILLEYLNDHKDVIVYGQRSSDASLRVPVVSFSVKGQSSKEVVEKVEACSDFGIRWGHFYSKKLVDEVLELGADGVIRVSMVHYNTEEEVRGLVEVFEKILL